MLLHVFATIYCTSYACVLVTQYIAPGPVRELSYEVISSTSVNITWKPPEETDGDIVSYFVEHGEHQIGPTTSVEVDARHEDTVINNIIHDMSKLLLYVIEYS